MYTMEKVTKTTLCHHFPVVLPSGPCSPSGPPFTSSSFTFSHGIVSQWYKMPRSTRPRARTSNGISRDLTSKNGAFHQ